MSINDPNGFIKEVQLIFKSIVVDHQEPAIEQRKEEKLASG